MSSSRAEAYQGGSHPLALPLLLANQLALSALLLFDFGLLRQVQICFQITLGYVAGKFSLEAAITRRSSCLSMLYRTGNLFCMQAPALLRTSAFQLAGGMLGGLHHFVLLDSHLASAICCKLILKKQRGEKMQLKWVLPFEQARSLPPLHGVRLGAGALQSGNPDRRCEHFTQRGWFFTHLNKKDTQGK